MPHITEFLFIDANIEDKQTLINSAASNVKVIELNNKTNAIDQIATTLQDVKNLDAIHIISHGSEGELDFANGVLNNDNLSNYSNQLKKIGSALLSTGDILLYGCDVANGNVGSAFINSLAKLIKADVAASEDLTGAASLGGDWVLENQTGKIETAVLQATNYQSVFIANALPLITGQSSASVTGDQSVAINGFTVSDTDNPTSLTVRIAATHGNLTLGTTTNITGYTVPATSITFSGAISDLNTALNSLSYQRTSGFSGTDSLTIAVSDDSGTTWQPYSFSDIPENTFLNTDNSHYYQFVASSSTWADAQTAATGSTLYGLHGYLVTITSQNESDFLRTNGGSNGWFGAKYVSGTWKWDAGPEAGQTLSYNRWHPGEESDGAGSERAYLYNRINNRIDSLNDNLSGDWRTEGGPTSYIVEYGGLGTDTPQTALAVNVVQNAAPTITFDSGYVLDGSNDYIDLPDLPTSGNGGIGQNFTLEAWLNISSVGFWTRIFDFGNGAGNNNIIWATSQDSTGKMAFEIYQGSSGTPQVIAPSALPLNQWVHVAAVVSGTTATLYQNGVQVATGTVKSANDVARTNNYIGQSNWSVDAHTSGQIKDARIWSVARTAQQIADNKTTISDSTGLYSRYLINDNTGTTITDSSVNSHNATLVNGATSSWIGAPNGTEDSTVVLRNFSISDSDSSSATVMLSVPAGEGTLSFATNISSGLLSGQITSGNGTNAVTVTAPLSAINTTIYGGGLSFTPPTTHSSDFPLTVTISVNDGSGGTATNTFNIAITADNDALTATNLSAAQTFTEDTVLNLTDIVVTDVDSATITATLTLSNTNAGSISTATSNSVTSTFANGIWTATGAKADVNTLLASATFTPTVNYNQSFTIATSVTDETTTLTGAKTFTGTAVNDAPAGTDKTITTNEDTTYTFTTSDFGFTDTIESNAFNRVKITTLPSAGTLSVTGGSTLSAGDFVSATDITAGKLKFTPASNANGNAYASFTFQVEDDGGTTNSGVNLDVSANAITVNVTAVNNSASISGNNTGGVTEDDVTSVSGLMTVTDIDNSGFIALNNVRGNYGVFSLASGGNWSYTLDNELTNVQTLNAGEQRSDNFTISSQDSTATSTVTINVYGKDEAITEDADGINNSIEQQVSSGSGIDGDGNGDGISDSEQPNVTSLPTDKKVSEDTNAEPVFLSIALPEGQTLIDAAVTPIKENTTLTFQTETVNAKGEKVIVDSPITPEQAPFGLFEFKLEGVQTQKDATGHLVGGTSEVKLYLDGQQTVEKYLKKTMSGNYETIPFKSNFDATLKKTVITLSLTDGDKYDLDGKIDGNINDPGTPILKVTAKNSPVDGTLSIDGILKQGEVIHVNNALFDANGLGAMRYQWLANGKKIVNATADSYTLAQKDVGKTFSVIATYTDGLGILESVTSSPTKPVLNTNDAPTGTVTIKGTAKSGEKLSVSYLLTDKDGLGAAHYQWFADDIAIAKATARHYMVTNADLGKAISVGLSYTDGLGAKEMIKSVPLNIPLTGSMKNDVLHGKSTDDYITGEQGNDRLYGEKGNDSLEGNDGKDWLYGGQGHDILNGGADADILWGNEGNDSLLGESGNDRLYGGKGEDTLNGGEGDDILDSGLGHDLLIGGEGKDIFVLSSEQDTIQDFDAKEDLIRLERQQFTAFNDRGMLTEEMFDTHLSYDKTIGELAYDSDGTGDVATIIIAQVGVDLALTAANFVIV